MDAIIIIALIFAGIYLFFNNLLPLILRFWIAKKMKEFGNKGGSASGFGGSTFYGTWGSTSQYKQAQNQQQPKEGEVHIEQNATSQKKVNTNVGDYIDYEEVKE